MALVRLGTSSSDAGTALVFLGQSGHGEVRWDTDALVAEQLGLGGSGQYGGQNGNEQDGSSLHDIMEFASGGWWFCFVEKCSKVISQRPPKFIM